MFVGQSLVLFPYLLHPFEQFLVVHDAGVVLGKHGREFLCQSIHFVRCVGIEEIEKDACDAFKLLSSSYGYGVLEGRLLRIIDDGFDGFILLLHRFDDSRFVVLNLDA